MASNNDISFINILSLKSCMSIVFSKQVSGARAEAEKDGVAIPTTLEEYCIKTKISSPESGTDMTDFYVDDYDIEEEDDDEEEEDEYEDADDSGNGES